MFTVPALQTEEESLSQCDLLHQRWSLETNRWKSFSSSYHYGMYFQLKGSSIDLFTGRASGYETDCRFESNFELDSCTNSNIVFRLKLCFRFDPVILLSL